MRISDRVYWVGSGSYGSELSHTKDCNVYVINGGGEYAMVDAGCGLEPERIVDRIERCGIPIAKVNKLLLTHIHADHAAGASFFHSQYGMQVYASEEAAPWLEEGDRERASLNAAISAGAYPIDFLYQPCPIARRLSEGDCLTVGDLELRVIDTPGHARGHICLEMVEDGHRSLFSGDAVFANGKIYVQNSWDCNIQEYAASIAKLHGLGIDRLYPGHGSFVWNRAHRHIEQAHRSFELLQLPLNL